ncbi:uncharacterized protein LOC128984348 [Macrosteles quadrilineatus]|uniref:uncharacterized protein LOC128984348 n=1 Tax=Macrosteles quadrilineatus TaxID=74068 RepID=UPI0023E0E63D|nr:uncharacterized protein LOC128984348 [Macrosteles quadrilineatus]
MEGSLSEQSCASLRKLLKSFFNSHFEFYSSLMKLRTPCNTEDVIPKEVSPENSETVPGNENMAFGRDFTIKGGVAIYKNINLQNETHSLEIEENSIPLICEVAAVKINLSNKRSLNLIGVYRPPSSCVNNMRQALSVLEEIFRSTATSDASFLMMGDINIDNLEPSTRKTRFDELLASFDIRRVPLPATRIAISGNNRSATSIDASWEDILSSDDVNEAYNRFIKTTILALDSACPRKRTRRPRSSRKIVYDAETMEMKREYLAAYDIFLLTNDLAEKQRASYFKRLYDLRLKEIRRVHSTTHIITADNKSKAVWDIINSERKLKKSSTTSCVPLSVDGVDVNDPSQVADYFNTYFTTIADETLKLNPPITLVTAHIDQHRNVIELKKLAVVTEPEIRKIIYSLKTKTSSGLDDISTKAVKFCSEELIKPLLHITNLSLCHGVFPQKMKVAKVMPLHKRGKKDDMRNYRPISLLPTFSKIIEKVVLAQLLQHLEVNKLLTENQHGFVKGRSTITALVDFVETLTDRIEEGSNVTAIFLDLSKAFDCLVHDLVLSKLSSLGIQDVALQWFSSYLKDRFQIVEIQHITNKEISRTRSSQQPVSRGVPQGSVLGPVIFILFTNDLPMQITPYGLSFMYADDTVILSADKSLDSLEVNSFIALNCALEYCHNNDLVFNEAKTKQLMFGSQREDIVGLPNIHKHNSTSHLGVVIDEGLTWREHVDSLCQRLNSAIFAIRRIVAIGTPEAVTVAYHALFESSMTYGIVLWGGSSVSNLERVLILQKEALRTMNGLQIRDSCRRVFSESKILTVVSMFVYETVLLSMRKGLPKNSDVHRHNTRFAKNYNLPYHRKQLFERKPSYLGAKLYNALPEELKNYSKAEKMKPHLKTWLSSRPFYTVEEFLNWKDFDLNDF